MPCRPSGLGIYSHFTTDRLHAKCDTFLAALDVVHHGQWASVRFAQPLQTLSGTCTRSLLQNHPPPIRRPPSG